MQLFRNGWEWLLRRLARSRDENFQFTETVSRAIEEEGRHYQWVSGYSTSKRVFFDKEAFLRFCETLDGIGGGTGITINGGYLGTGADASGRILDGPDTDYRHLEFGFPVAGFYGLTMSSANISGLQPISYIVKEFIGVGQQQMPPAIQEALRRYTRAAPRWRTWNKYRSFPLVENTPRAEVAQRKWQGRIQLISAGIGFTAGLAGALALDLLQIIAGG